MEYSVTIKSPGGKTKRYSYGSTSDQQATVFASKIVEANVAGLDLASCVTITRDGAAISEASTVREVIQAACLTNDRRSQT